MKFANLNKGLVGHWALDSLTGLTDLSPYGNHGTAQGGLVVGGSTDQHGQGGRATSFDGASNEIISKNIINISSNQPRTIAGWFRQTTSLKRNIVGFGGSSELKCFDIIADKGKVYGYFYGIGNDTATNAPSYVIDTWNHFVLTYDGVTAFFYLNGVYRNFKTITLNTTNSTFNIGKGTWIGAAYFNGNLSDVRIYNRALSQIEITQLYTSYRPKIKMMAYDDNNPNLVAAWHMNEGSGTTIADSSINKNTGTFGGGTANPTWATTPGKKCLSFDGANSVVNCVHNTSLDITSAISICTWIKPHTYPNAYPRIISKETGGSVNAYNMYIDTTGLNKLAFVSVGTFLSGAPILLNIWTYIVCTYDKNGGVNNCKIYLNNIISNQTTISYQPMNSTSDNVLIGNNPTNIRQFDGLIDEVRIYNTALNQTQITNLFTIGKLTHN